MSGIAFREVDIRTWPQRTDVMVMDPQEMFLLAHYQLQDPTDPLRGVGPLFDPLTPYGERSTLAIHAVENDQEGLQRYFLLQDDAVCLRASDSFRQRMEEVLVEYGLSLAEVELSQLYGVQQKLESMPLDHFWLLLADWHDVAERHYPAGSSAADPWSWLQRSRPDSCRHFHILSAPEGEDAGDDAAYEEFLALVNTSLADFSLGVFLRWIYFHRAEFPSRSIPQHRALQELPALR